MSTQHVIVGETSKKIIPHKEATFQFPSLRSIYMAIANCNLENFFPTYSQFKEHIWKVWEESTKQQFLQFCEYLFEELDEQEGFDREDSVWENEEWDSEDFGEILYNNLDALFEIDEK